MADTTQTNSKTTPVPGIPFPPAGYDENGKPYWLINGNVVDWNQMQQYIWQQQKQGRVTGKGPEGLTQVPNMEVNLEVQPQFEQIKSPDQADNKSEKSGEKEAGVDANTSSTSVQTVAAVQKEEKKPDKPDFFGDSPALPNLATNDPPKLLAQAKTLAKAPPETSDRFLGVSLLRKFLQIAFGQKF